MAQVQVRVRGGGFVEYLKVDGNRCGWHQIQNGTGGHGFLHTNFQMLNFCVNLYKKTGRKNIFWRPKNAQPKTHRTQKLLPRVASACKNHKQKHECAPTKDKAPPQQRNRPNGKTAECRVVIQQGIPQRVTGQTATGGHMCASSCPVQSTLNIKGSMNHEPRSMW